MSDHGFDFEGDSESADPHADEGAKGTPLTDIEHFTQILT